MCYHLFVCICLSIKCCFVRCLYVCVVAVLILLCGGVLTGFMYPRNVNVTIVSVNSTNRMFIIVPSLNVSDNNTTPVLQITVMF